MGKVQQHICLDATQHICRTVQHICLDAAQRRTSLRHDQVSQYNTCSSKALMLHNNGIYRERRINQMPG